MVYNDSAETARSVLTWFNRTGKALGEVGGIGVLANPMLSPDDSRVAVDMSDLKANNVDVWIEGLTGGNNARFTFEPAEEVVGVWSRDGKSIVYRSAANVATLLVKATTWSGSRDDAIAAWRAEPRTTPGGQPYYSALAITTALTLRGRSSIWRYGKRKG